MRIKCTLELVIPEAMYDLQQAWKQENKEQVADLLLALGLFCAQQHPTFAQEIWEELVMLSDIVIQTEYLESENPEMQRLGRLFAQVRQELCGEDKNPPPSATIH